MLRIFSNFDAIKLAIPRSPLIPSTVSTWPVDHLFKDFTVDQKEDFFFLADKEASLHLKNLSWPLFKRRASYFK